MNAEETVREINRIHLDHPQLLGQIAGAVASGGEAGVMLWLSQQQGDIFAVDIINHFGLTPGRVANIVKRLEQRGYIVRETDAEDLRKSRIRMTGKGTSYADSVSKMMTENHLRMVRVLGEEDSAHALRILRKIIAVYESGLEFAVLK